MNRGTSHTKQGEWKRAHQTYSIAIEVAAKLAPGNPLASKSLTDLGQSDRKILQRLSRRQ
jgi:hypothetical protein